MSDQPETLAGDLLWTAKDIAAFIGRTKRQTDEALMKGDLPARQVNGRWVASRKALAAFFSGMDIGEAQSASPATEAPLAAPRSTPGSVTAKQRVATVHKLQPRKGRAVA